jgi:ATP phosphoribosyltransferase
MTERTFRLAVPNKGRLKDATARLLREAGLAFEQTERALSVRVRNVDMDLLFVRTEDIAELLMDGVADMGVTGLDLLSESEMELPILAELGFGRCQLVVAVPKDSDIDKPEDFAGLRIATSHPEITQHYFQNRGISVNVIPLRGSVEVAPKLGIADAIADLVSTGSTMLINGLRPVVEILESQAVLAASPHSVSGRAEEMERVRMALMAVVAGRRKRYLLLNAPADAVDRIAAIIPGLEAPTVVPLAEADRVAMHSVVDAGEVWSLLPDLKREGAHDILVLPIEQLIP